jgi:hypothetical protein
VSIFYTGWQDEQEGEARRSRAETRRDFFANRADGASPFKVAIGQNDLTDFHDIQATKASGFGVPGVPGDELGGAAQLSSRDMQQIQGPAASGGGSAGNHAKRSVEYAPAIQVRSLEAALGEEIGLHFKTGIELKWRDFASVEFGMKGVVKLQLHEKRIGSR